MIKLVRNVYLYKDIEQSIYFEGNMNSFGNHTSKLYIGKYELKKDCFGNVYEGYYFPKLRLLIVDEGGKYIGYKPANEGDFHRRWMWGNAVVTETNIDKGKLQKYTWSEKKDSISHEEIECVVRTCIDKYGKDKKYYYTSQGFLDISSVRIKGFKELSGKEITHYNLDKLHTVTLYFERNLTKKEEFFLKENLRKGYGYSISKCYGNELAYGISEKFFDSTRLLKHSTKEKSREWINNIELEEIKNVFLYRMEKG